MNEPPPWLAKGPSQTGPTNKKRRPRDLADIAGSMLIVAALTGAGTGRNEMRLPRVDPPARAANEMVMPPLEHSDSIPAREAARDAQVLNETDVILDTTLITKDMPCGIPLELRKGWLDPRVEPIVREIDDVLGGCIEWPNVYVTDKLTLQSNAHALYRHDINDKHGTTIPTADNAAREPLERFGIHLEADLVNNELSTCRPGGRSIRSILVHELQHALSHDNSRQLRRAAEVNRNPYEEGRFSSEGRAEMARLVYAEAAQRADAGGPRLNELEPADRREVVREMITRLPDTGRSTIASGGRRTAARDDAQQRLPVR